MSNFKPVTKLKWQLVLLLFCLFSVACKSNKNNQPADSSASQGMDSATKIVVKKAPQWAAMLKHSSGWIGADGIYAVPLDGDMSSGRKPIETLFWFSDCIYGNVDHDTLSKGWSMGHNSVAYFKGGDPDPDKIKFYHGVGPKDSITSMFEPHSPQTKKGDYFWLGSGVFDHAKDSTIYIVAYRIHNVPGKVFPFEQVGAALIAIPKGSRPPFKNQRQIDAPLYFNDAHISFGTCMLANTVGAHAPKPDGYIYVYGVKNPGAQLVVSRAKDVDFEDFFKWTYWDGSKWGNDVHKCAGLLSGVSNEMSVSYMDADTGGRVIATYQKSNTSTIFVSVGGSVKGPFFPEKKVWDTPETYEDIDFYTYNAKAYPFLSKKGELLISYNVNAFDFGRKITIHPYHLRPRFITVKY